MSKLKVENFGPITTGLKANDGFIDFRKVTVFIGNQGTGKSSIAKLYSTMSWLEKALFQGKLSRGHVTQYNRFINTYCNYQNLKHYFKPDTVIEYQGKAYDLSFRNGKLSVEQHSNDNGYQVPKIMYVPAERNFLSATANPEKLKGLPASLSTFQEELERSQQELSENLTLPVGNAKLHYDKLNKIARISGKGYEKGLRLTEASSGFQSLVPLYLVSHNLATAISKDRDVSRSELSGEDRKRLRTEVDRIYANDKLPADMKQVALEALFSKFRNETFLNIVEEPEQNLFPQSQQAILFQLLKFVNTTEENELVLTTHSPYIINYLTLAIKGHQVLAKLKTDGSKDDQWLAQVKKVIRPESTLASQDAVVYELSEHGSVKQLETPYGLPSDENYLNQQLEEVNSLFADLLDLESA